METKTGFNKKRYVARLSELMTAEFEEGMVVLVYRWNHRLSSRFELSRAEFEALVAAAEDIGKQKHPRPQLQPMSNESRG